jgi:hypothetical protein
MCKNHKVPLSYYAAYAEVGWIFFFCFVCGFLFVLFYCFGGFVCVCVCVCVCVGVCVCMCV